MISYFHTLVFPTAYSPPCLSDHKIIELSSHSILFVSESLTSFFFISLAIRANVDEFVALPPTFCTP